MAKIQQAFRFPVKICQFQGFTTDPAAKSGQPDCPLRLEMPLDGIHPVESGQGHRNRMAPGLGQGQPQMNRVFGGIVDHAGFRRNDKYSGL